MSQIIFPVAKKLYICDDVLRDPDSGKVSVLNIWETIRAHSFPHLLDKLCVFAQFRSGLGEVPFRIEITRADTGHLTGKLSEFSLSFEDRSTRHDVTCTLRKVAFPSPGTYFVALYCNREFVDDQPIRVLSESF